MSFSAIFYTLSKRPNSTKQPSGSGTTYDIVLKDNCSILTPDIKLDVGIAANPADFNYCYIADFKRYYYVSWEWSERLWIGHCKVDALASQKSAIGSYTAYVARAASTYDGDVVDTYYPALADVTELKESATQDPGWSTSIGSGQFVIGVMGDDSGPNGGAVTYYAINAAGMYALTDYLLDDSNYNVTDISQDLLKCIFNPLQYIVSCMWFPFQIAATSVINIEVGWWTISTAAAKLSDPVYTRNLSFNIPKHPLAATRGNYLNLAPYSCYCVNAGPWGLIPVDNSELIGENSVAFQMTVDLYTGSGRLSQVSKDVLAYVNEQVCQIGVPVQLGQNVINQGALMQTASSGLGAIGSAVSLNPLSFFNNGLNSIVSAAELSQSVPSMLGSNGTIAFNTIFALVGKFYDVAAEDNTSIGRPLMQPKTISSLSGYIECVDADPPLACTLTEMEEIVSAMNGGFYYE